MDEDSIENINSKIYQRFPYLKDIAPKQNIMPDGTITLSYSTSQETASGMTLPITIKVKVSPSGKIINISTSK